MVTIGPYAGFKHRVASTSVPPLLKGLLDPDYIWRRTLRLSRLLPAAGYSHLNSLSSSAHSGRRFNTSVGWLITQSSDRRPSTHRCKHRRVEPTLDQKAGHRHNRPPRSRNFNSSGTMSSRYFE